MMPRMERLQRAAVLCGLAAALRDADSWCGETHLQKATFLLEEGRDVPLGYRFVLYKYGPFSFDLREELEDLRGRGFVRLEPQAYPYGPRLGLTDRGRLLLRRYPKTLGRFVGEVDDVVAFVGSHGVSALERLATAVHLVEEQPQGDDDVLAAQLRSIKPHVSPDGAADAIAKAREFLKASESV